MEVLGRAAFRGPFGIGSNVSVDVLDRIKCLLIPRKRADIDLLLEKYSVFFINMGSDTVLESAKAQGSD